MQDMIGPSAGQQSGPGATIEVCLICPTLGLRQHLNNGLQYSVGYAKQELDKELTSTESVPCENWL